MLQGTGPFLPAKNSHPQRAFLSFKVLFFLSQGRRCPFGGPTITKGNLLFYCVIIIPYSIMDSFYISRTRVKSTLQGTCFSPPKFHTDRWPGSEFLFCQMILFKISSPLNT